ncbi:hypothetical protein EC973_003977 [Apophysomyces ossiformis]|uniref:Uncharacterized protein n=1 Tax=Apophysomyces ossiformis TaxID=679940 RepID=A0A8H7BIT7_9FUNG|nr:hypothetical protein EC973_003977 [Apophysomyces ossiformis]
MAFLSLSRLPTSSKQMSRSMIAIQLSIVFLLCCLFVVTLHGNAYRNNFTSDAFLQQSSPQQQQPPTALESSLSPSTTEEQQKVLPQPITKEKKQYPYTIVTASSANHLCSLENFLYSLHNLRSELDPSEFPRVVVYNIGMNRTQLPVLDQLKANNLMDELETFDYFKYPRFFDIAINAGEYAWKPAIVNEARVKYGDTKTGVLVWLDAGNMLTAPFLKNIPSIVRKNRGFWSPRSSYTMGRWTHPGMYAYFNVNPADYANNINCNGAAAGFDLRNKAVVNNIIIPWYECGLDKDCIAPPGSSRRNHRQDQAVLTFLAYRNNYKCQLAPIRYHNLQVHRDISCRHNLMELELQGKLTHPSALDFPKWNRTDTLALYNHPEWRFHEDEVPEHITRLHDVPDIA